MSDTNLYNSPTDELDELDLSDILGDEDEEFLPLDDFNVDRILDEFKDDITDTDDTDADDTDITDGEEATMDEEENKTDVGNAPPQEPDSEFSAENPGRAALGPPDAKPQTVDMKSRVAGRVAPSTNILCVAARKIGGATAAGVQGLSGAALTLFRSDKLRSFRIALSRLPIRLRSAIERLRGGTSEASSNEPVIRSAPVTPLPPRPDDFIDIPDPELEPDEAIVQEDDSDAVEKRNAIIENLRSVSGIYDMTGLEFTQDDMPEVHDEAQAHHIDLDKIYEDSMREQQKLRYDRFPDPSLGRPMSENIHESPDIYVKPGPVPGPATESGGELPSAAPAADSGDGPAPSTEDVTAPGEESIPEDDDDVKVYVMKKTLDDGSADDGADPDAVSDPDAASPDTDAVDDNGRTIGAPSAIKAKASELKIKAFGALGAAVLAVKGKFVKSSPQDAVPAPAQESAEPSDDTADEGDGAASAAEISDSDAQYASPEAATGDSSASDEAKTSRFKIPAALAPAAERFGAFIAAVKLWRAQNSGLDTITDDSAEPQEEPDDSGMTSERASSFYISQVKKLRPRMIIASVMSAALIIFSLLCCLGLIFSGKAQTPALICLILELIVVLMGVDVFTKGIMNFVRGYPGIETLVAVSCLFSAADAVYIAATGSFSVGLPLCAVSALSMACAIWSSYFTCMGFLTSLRTASQIGDSYAVTSVSGIDDTCKVLMKTYRPQRGFVHRTEDADSSEAAYMLFAPFFLILSIILGVLAALLNSESGDLLHCISATTAICVSLSSLLCFPLPFAAASKRLRRRGIAISGHTGCCEIATARRVVITDNDIFPPESISITQTNIASGFSDYKVIAYTGSIILASESALVPVFKQLMYENDCALYPVSDFKCHDSGGLSATIDGCSIVVGPSSFMNLNGIRTPKKVNDRYIIFSAINGILCSYYTLKYLPASDCVASLTSLIRSRRAPLFAIRDFNVTPELLRRKFDMNTDSFDFPPLTERYRISSSTADRDAAPAAVLSKGALSPFVYCTNMGRRLYYISTLGTFMSLIASLAGLIIAFIMCRVAAFGLLNPVTLSAFLLLWLIPVIIFTLSFSGRSRR